VPAHRLAMTAGAAGTGIDDALSIKARYRGGLA